MPVQLCHRGTFMKNVKPEFYTDVNKLNSSNLCSKNQPVSAIIIVANEMFEDSESIKMKILFC